MNANLLEPLWVLYALFFVPSRLETHLNAAIENMHENVSPTQLLGILEKFDQPAARRYSKQVVMFCMLAAFPLLFQLILFQVLWLFLGDQDILLGNRLLTLAVIVLGGIGLTVWNTRLGIFYVFAQSLLLVTQPGSMLWIHSIFSEPVIRDLQVILWPALMIAIVISLGGGVLGGENTQFKFFSRSLSGFVAFIVAGGIGGGMAGVAAGVIAVIVTGFVADVVAEGVSNDRTNFVAGALAGTVAGSIVGGVASIVAISVAVVVGDVVVGSVAGGVTVIVAGGVAVIVTVIVGRFLAGVVVGFVADNIVGVFVGGVGGIIGGVAAVIVAIVVATLTSISLTTLTFNNSWKWVIVLTLGFGLSGNRWRKRRDLLWPIALIGVIGTAFWPEWQLMLFWWLLGIVGLLRIPLYLVYALRNAWAQFRFRTVGIAVLPQPWLWDELIPFPLPYLDQLVVQQEHSTALQVIEMLSSTWRQGGMAQRARLRLIATDLAQAQNETAIATVDQQLRWLPDILPDTVAATVGRFQAISRMVQRKINLTDPEAQLQALSQTLAAVDALIAGLTFVPQRERELFLPVAQQWQAILRQGTTRLPNPYVAGDPLRRKSSSLFMGREDVLHELEIQLQNRSQRPTLVLFGQRRMGKSSLLYQLPHKFDDNTIPVRIDCQAPEMQEGNPAFLFFLATAMYTEAKETRALTLAPVPASSEMSFSTFRLWLDAVELLLGDRIMLLCFDEYEKIGEAVMAGYLDARILDFLRNLIQHRAQITLLLVGSHRPQEIGRPWSNYLISAVVLPIGYLQTAEARKLIKEPIPGFPLHYSEAAVERIIALTQCQPLLVQLLCQQMVILLNRRGEQAADVAEVEAAIPSALEQGGSLYFTYLAEYDAGDVGRSMLKNLAARGEGGTLSEERLVANEPARQKALETLLSRDILECVDGDIRFEVELTRRWWADYG